MKMIKNWQIKQLGELGTFDKGAGISKADILPKGLPCIRYAEIYSKYDFQAKEFSSYISAETAKTSKPITQGTLLFAGSGETAEDIGKSVAYMGNSIAYASGDTILFKFHNSKENVLFYSYYLNTIGRKQLNKLGAGQSIVHIYPKELAKVEVPCPSAAEQRKIVEVLETWDKEIGLTKRLIEQKELQKKYLMQQLLTGRTRLKGFTCEWKLLPLSEILKERKEYQAKNQNLPHLSLTKEGVLPKTDRYNRDFLVKDEDKLYKITHENDICYNPANLKFGVICRNQYGSGIFSPIYVTYEVTKYSSGFVGYLLTLPSSIAQARRFEEGTVYERMAVSSEDFLKVKLPFPTCEEESKQISIVIRKAEEEIALLRQKLAKLEEQKKGLMQLLLTGKVRLEI